MASESLEGGKVPESRIEEIRERPLRAALEGKPYKEEKGG
jgi:hypothetical protein